MPGTRSVSDSTREVAALDVDRAATVATAFSVYFQLVNLAEERHRVRTLRQRARRARGALDESIVEAVEELRRGHSRGEILALVERLSVSPVRHRRIPRRRARRTLLLALRRVERLMERLDDLRATPEEDADLRRRLREEITILWRTADLRSIAPAPLDEVRTALAFFDETLFGVVPRAVPAGSMARWMRCRRRRQATAATARRRRWPQTPGAPGRGRRLVPAFLRFGSWIGADRDGHPGVTAETTQMTMRIHADHVLHGYEAVSGRLMQTIAIRVSEGDVERHLASALARDAEELPETVRQLRRRFPDEPYRQRFGAIAERLRRTRAALTGEAKPLTGRYPDVAAFDTDLATIQAALVADGAARVAWGEVADLRWQLATFGFHLASLEVRQHAVVHEAALAALAAGKGPETLVGQGVTLGEVLATFRAVARLQVGGGEAACHRYIISFTRSPADVRAVLELARRAADADLFGGDAAAFGGLRAAEPALDVVPLLESRGRAGGCGRVPRSAVRGPGVSPAPRDPRGSPGGDAGLLGFIEESGFLAANWLLHEAQEALVIVARRHGIALTLFHGRGGALGPRGGPANRAILAQAAGSVDGRLKYTEQGEVVADRYAAPAIARRHLEQVTSATLLASTAEHEAQVSAAAARRGADPGRARRLGPGGLPGAGRPVGVRGVLRGGHADQRAGRAGPRLPPHLPPRPRRVTAPRGSGDAPRDPLGVRMVAGTGEPAGLVWAGDRAGVVRGAGRRARPGTTRHVAPPLAVPGIGAGQRGALAGQDRSRDVPAVRRARERARHRGDPRRDRG